MGTIIAGKPSSQPEAEPITKVRLSLVTRLRLTRAWLVTFRHILPARDDNDLPPYAFASPLFRFFRSKHVFDLRLIFGLTILAFLIHAAIAIALSVTAQGSTAVSTYLGPAVPGYGAILAWTYLSAAKRLGVVDLFGSEIVALCRVGTFFDIGLLYMQLYQRMGKDHNHMALKQSAHSTNVGSLEDSFPILANNSGDLQSLGAVLVANITEFYTYMRATRDILARIESVEAAQPITANIIYMLYLSYESARRLINDLVEIRPVAAENIIAILLTELPCYSFVCKHFASDQLRFARLTLNLGNYKKEVSKLIDEVGPHGDDDQYWVQPSGRYRN